VPTWTGDVWLGDLIEAMRLLGTTVPPNLIAEALGFVGRELPERPEAGAPFVPSGPGGSAEPPKVPPSRPRSEPSKPTPHELRAPLDIFDRVPAPKQRPTPGWLSTSLPPPVESAGHVDVRLPHRPLLPAKWSRAIIGAACATDVEDGGIDVEKLVEALATGAPIREIPRSRVRSLVRGMQLLVDRSTSLAPFRRDVAHLSDQLRSVVGRDRSEVEDFDGFPAGLGEAVVPPDRPYRMPPPGTPVIVISDLGMSPAPPRRRGGTAAQWTSFADKLRRRGCPLVAFAPYPLSRWPSPLLRSVKAVPWDRSTTVSSGGRVSEGRALRVALPPELEAAPLPDEGGPSSRQVAALACLLSIAARVEPELVRAMRLARLPGSRAELEAALWFSRRLVQGQGYDALTLHPAAVAVLRAELGKPALRAQLDQAWEIVAATHGGHSPFIVLEELVTYLALRGDATSLGRMEEELGRVVKLLSRSSDDALARWVARVIPRLPEMARTSDAAIALVRLANFHLRGLRVSGTPQSVTPGVDELAALPTIEVGAALLIDELSGAAKIALEVPPGPDAVTLAVPLTEPIAVDVGRPTREGWTTWRQILTRGARATLEVPAGPALRLTTLTGEGLRVRPQGPRSNPVVLLLWKGGGPLESLARDLGWEPVFDVQTIRGEGRDVDAVLTDGAGPGDGAGLLAKVERAGTPTLEVDGASSASIQSARQFLIDLDERRYRLWRKQRRELDRRPGLGAMPHAEGTAFRVWAPNATSVLLVNEGTGWNPARGLPLEREGQGTWYADVAGVKPGEGYKYFVKRGSEGWFRSDPRARALEGQEQPNSVVASREPHPGTPPFATPPLSDLVLYQLNVGTFSAGPQGVGTFQGVVERLDYLRALGINALQLLPVVECAAGQSLGYDPSHIFAVRQAYGGPRGLKTLIDQAHVRGIAVFVDLVLDHIGPQNQLWAFDGSDGSNAAGIYFYGDARANSPWGTRYDYAKPEVRQFLRDNVLMWLEEYGADGARWSATEAISHIRAGGAEISEGYALMSSIVGEMSSRFPRRHMIAEDQLQDRRVLEDTASGGLGFAAQWDYRFGHDIRAAMITPNDDQRSIVAVREAISAVLAGVQPAHRRVIYTESFDTVMDQGRLPGLIWPGQPRSWFARRRSMLAAALTLTVPGVPLLFQGQEFLATGRPTETLDWSEHGRDPGVLQFYRDLLRLRWDWPCLRSPHLNVFHVNEADKIIAFQRYASQEKADTRSDQGPLVVAANLASRAQPRYQLGFPKPGPWRVVFSSDRPQYGDGFKATAFEGTTAHDGPVRDGQPFNAEVYLGEYGVVVLAPG
jgi:1,4-alpha-glucan branching enzyme